MRTRLQWCAALGVSALGLMLVATASMTAASETVEFDVQSNVRWQNSGVELCNGDQLTIDATGIVCIMLYGNFPVTPDGCLADSLPDCITNPTNPTTLCPDVSHRFSLVGRIGDEGDCFIVGSHYEAVVENGGTLWLAVNDDWNDYWDNSGSFVTHIQRLSTETPGWCDNFDDYPPGSFPSPQWYRSGNVGGAYVDNAVSYSGSQSMHLFGVIGGCWGVLAARPLEVEFPFTIEMVAWNGTESLSGCHPYRGSLELKTGPHWSNQGFGLLRFIENGDLEIIVYGSSVIFNGFALNEWHLIRVELSAPTDGYLHHKVWANGDYLGEYTRPWESWMSNITHLLIGSQEGTTWFDDVCVFAGQTQFEVHLDIKPGSCPNPLNVKNGRMDEGESRWGSSMATGDGGDPAISEVERGKKAVLPAAILGTAEFDVAQIDATTVVLAGVPVVRWHYEDVATPVAEDADECECNDYGPDGFVDMTLKFYRVEIIAALGEVYDGDVIPLTISGQLIDGTPFEGVDCVVILGDNLPMADVGGDDVPSIPGVNNFPNPFNPVTTISFSLPVASHVTLEVYNVMGQRVTTVTNGFYEAGVHACEWDGSAVASGVYFYRIETDAYTETKKMMLLK